MNQPIPVEAHHHTEGVLGHLHFRTMRFDHKGDFIQLHEHRFDHVTIVIRGPLLCKYGVDGKKEREVTEGERVLIRAHVIHGFEALADNCLAYCVNNYPITNLGGAIPP